jgi:hypothetical protein
VVPDYLTNFINLNLGMAQESEVRLMARVKCRPERTGKTGPKSIRVKTHRRSRPKPIRKKCG